VALRLGSVPVFVSDQDRALEFYRDKLGFEVVADIPVAERIRWVAVASRKGEAEIILYPPAFGGDKEEELKRRVGQWTGMVFLTEDIRATYEMLRQRGVEFEAEPSQQPWGGLETWFSDPDGNRLHLAQRPDWMT